VPNAARLRLTALGGPTRTRVIAVLAGVLALSSAEAATRLLQHAQPGRLQSRPAWSAT